MILNDVDVWMIEAIKEFLSHAMRQIDPVDRHFQGR